MVLALVSRVQGLGLEGPGLGLGLECPGLGLGLRILAMTTLFFDRYFFVYFLILETFAVGPESLIC